MKRVNNSIYLLFLNGILFLFLLFNQSCNYVEKRHEQRKTSAIQGIVVEKYMDKWNHGSPTLKLNTGSIIGVGSWAKNSYLWDHIEIGDSISKPSGTTDLTLFKKNGEYFLYTYNE